MPHRMNIYERKLLQLRQFISSSKSCGAAQEVIVSHGGLDSSGFKPNMANSVCHLLISTVNLNRPVCQTPRRMQIAKLPLKNQWQQPSTLYLWGHSLLGAAWSQCFILHNSKVQKHYGCDFLSLLQLNRNSERSIRISVYRLSAPVQTVPSMFGEMPLTP